MRCSTVFFFQAEDGIRDKLVTGVQTCALPIWARSFQQGDSYMLELLEAVGREHGFSMDVPLNTFSEAQMKVLMYGADKKLRVKHKNYQGRWHEFDVHYEGAVNIVKRRHSETNSDTIRRELELYMSDRPCPTCKGRRLKPESLAITIDDKSISQVASFSVREAHRFFHYLAGDTDMPTPLSAKEQLIAKQILKEIKARLGFLMDVGLDYLTINRTAATLAGGEAQRIRLATQIGSSLMGVLYILDEPSIGLHQRDNDRLISTLVRLRDLGNTLIVVEHDEETIRSADWVIDIGPGAGEHGGELIHSGPLADLLENSRSITAGYLRGDRFVVVPRRRRKGSGEFLTVRGAAENNLRDIDVAFPLGRFVAVTGVSGSGKSSLVSQILYPALAARIWGARDRPGQHRAIEGIDLIDKVIEIDQSPIGRTPRSNPATYTGLWGPLRELLAAVPEARLRGYRPGRFSFNV